MKICVPINIRHEGGGFYFLRLFVDYLARRGIQWTDRPEGDFDVLFANSWLVPFDLILRLKRERPNLRVVHRVDGAAQDYGRRGQADHWQASVNMLADATIFQSDYGKFATRRKFKVIAHDGPVIYNPVDLELFRPDGERVPLPGRRRLCNAAWSTNPMKGTWRLADLARANPQVTFVLCGRYPELPPLPNLYAAGHLDYPSLARVMRSCDAYLELSENECCPNVVLQALASGLPVLHKASGGTPELVADAGAALRDDLTDFAAVLASVLEQREAFGRKARHRAATLFAPDVVLSQYLAVISHAARRPLPGRLKFLAAQLRGYPVVPYPLWQYPFRKLAALVRKRARSKNLHDAPERNESNGCASEGDARKDRGETC